MRHKSWKITIFVRNFYETMATILNIETSTDVCSVALTQDGQVLEHHEDYQGHNHAVVLSRFVESCVAYARTREIPVDAVAVSIGPGSYTGLRIGLSEAKGLCFGLSVPLIGVNTLQLLVVSTMFANFFDDDNLLYVPMLDARRKEVYTAVYTPALEPIVQPQPMILDAGSLSQLRDGSHTLVLIGNGSDKAHEILSPGQDLRFIPGVKPVAVDMMALAEKHFREGEFLDVAYSTPAYLKEFQATTPKKLI